MGGSPRMLSVSKLPAGAAHRHVPPLGEGGSIADGICNGPTPRGMRTPDRVRPLAQRGGWVHFDPRVGSLWTQGGFTLDPVLDFGVDFGFPPKPPRGRPGGQAKIGAAARHCPPHVSRPGPGRAGGRRFRTGKSEPLRGTASRHVRRRWSPTPAAREIPRSRARQGPRGWAARTAP